jgi:hypothetical protein
MKQDQAPNQSHPNKDYASSHANLSQPAHQYFDHSKGDPINVALWGWLEMAVPAALEQLAHALGKHRPALIREVYRKLSKPKDRICLGWGFVFASSIAQIRVLKPNWQENSSEETPLPKDALIIPGMNLATTTFDTAQYAMVFAFLGHLDRMMKFARCLSREDALEFAQALHIAEKIATMYGDLAPKAFEIPEPPAEAFAVEMAVAWLDEWCENRLQEENQCNGARAKLIPIAEAKRRARLGNRPRPQTANA